MSPPHFSFPTSSSYLKIKEQTQKPIQQLATLAMAVTHIFVFFFFALILLITSPTDALPTPSKHHYTKRYGYHNTYKREVDRASRIARGSKHAARLARLIQRNKHAEKNREQKQPVQNQPNYSRRFRSTIYV